MKHDESNVSTVTQHNETRWLTPSQQAAWRAYIEVQGDLIRAIERDLLDAGLSLGDYQVLVYLSEAQNHSMRMCDLADMLQLSPSGLTRRLDRLVENGAVAREGLPADRRVMMASLTPHGLNLLSQTAPHHVESVQRHIFDQLDDEQVTAMQTIFASITAGLTADDHRDRKAS